MTPGEADPGTPILDEIELGSARGGKRRPAPLLADVVRPLGAADVPALLDPPPLNSKVRPVEKMRYTHHQLARLLAAGRSQEEACIVTGYSVSFVSNLMNHDEQFKRLVEYYGVNEEEIFVDLLERAKALGLMALEELQERLAGEPEGWTKQQLMDLAEMVGMKPALALRASRALSLNVGGPAEGGGISITFVKPQERPLIDQPKDVAWKDEEGRE